MSEPITIQLVYCSDDPAKQSAIREIEVDASILESRLIRKEQQEPPAGQTKDLHLAAPSPEHGQVTYLQEVHDGGFFVYVGDPANLEEHWFGSGSRVAFVDDQGSGHASKVGPDGCRRTLSILKDHLG